MSGNSSESRRTTSPIRSIRLLVPRAVFIRASSLDEGQAVLAALGRGAVLEHLVGDPPSVDEGAVQRALVLDEETPVVLDEHGVVARDGDVVEEDVAVR